jgi:hypothetical protein
MKQKEEGSKTLFPLYGVIMGKTTNTELRNRKEFKADKQGSKEFFTFADTNFWIV